MPLLILKILLILVCGLAGNLIGIGFYRHNLKLIAIATLSALAALYGLWAL